MPPTPISRSCTARARALQVASEAALLIAAEGRTGIELRWIHPAPGLFLEAGARGRDGVIDIGGVAIRDGSQQPAGGRIDHADGLTARRVVGFTVYEQLTWN